MSAYMISRIHHHQKPTIDVCLLSGIHQHQKPTKDVYLSVIWGSSPSEAYHKCLPKCYLGFIIIINLPKMFTYLSFEIHQHQKTVIIICLSDIWD